MHKYQLAIQTYDLSPKNKSDSIMKIIDYDIIYLDYGKVKRNATNDIGKYEINTNILKIADNRRKEIEQSGKDVEIVTVGKKATRYFTYRKINVS